MLNVLAAAAQMSSLTHVEIAIGGLLHRIRTNFELFAHRKTTDRKKPLHYESVFAKSRPSRPLAEEAGTNGMMTNVCRVFNDKVGVVRLAIAL